MTVQIQQGWICEKYTCSQSSRLGPVRIPLATIGSLVMDFSQEISCQVREESKSLWEKALRPEPSTDRFISWATEEDNPTKLAILQNTPQNQTKNTPKS